MQLAGSIATKGFLDFLNNLSSLVFWVRSADYQQQLFVSKGFEQIWQCPTDTLYNHPEYFDNSLINNAQNIEGILLRQQNDYAGVVHFNIHNASGNICWIRDTSCTLKDKQGNTKLVAGIGELIQPNTDYQRYIADNQLTENSFFQQFLLVLQNELKLDTENCKESSASKKGEFVEINNRIVWLTQREIDTLKYLLAGKSAKQTAAELNISIRTVETYLDNIRKKTGCRSKLILLSKAKF